MESGSDEKPHPCSLPTLLKNKQTSSQRYLYALCLPLLIFSLNPQHPWPMKLIGHSILVYCILFYCILVYCIGSFFCPLKNVFYL